VLPSGVIPQVCSVPAASTRSADHLQPAAAWWHTEEGMLDRVHGTQLPFPVRTPAVGVSFGVKPATVGCPGNDRDQSGGAGDDQRRSVTRSQSDAKLSVVALSPAAGEAPSDGTRVLPADGQCRASSGGWRCGAVAACRRRTMRAARVECASARSICSSGYRGVLSSAPGDAPAATGYTGEPDWAFSTLDNRAVQISALGP